jgi:hypothetical protein
MEIIIPENWSEVSLEQYVKFYKSIRPYENTKDYEKKILENSIYHFCGISADVYKSLPEKVFTDLSTSILELIKKSSKEKLVLSFELFGQKYGFISSFDDITYGEYVDLITYSKDTWNNIALIMAILYRPITEEKGDKYNIEFYNGTNNNQVDLFNKKLTMDIVFGGLSFFFNLQLDLVTDILNFSMKNLQKISQDPKHTKLLHILQKNGTSIAQLQSLQTIIH